MKKTISVLASLLLIANMAAFAEDNKPAEAIDTIPTEIQGDIMLINEELESIPAYDEAQPSYVCTYGTIKELGENSFTIETQDKDELVINYSDKTYMIDASLVAPFDIENRTSDEVVVYHSTATTMSIPAQTAAFAVMGNVAQGASVPVYTEVEDIKTSDDGLVIVTEGGSKEVTLLADAEVMPYRTKNIVKAQDITKGSKILLWYDMVTMSIPAYATSEKAVILEIAVAEETEETENNNIDFIFDGTEGIYEKGEIKMIPLRAVAEKLGFTVDWIDESMSVIVSKGAFSSQITIGDVNGGLNRARLMLQVAPELTNDKTYVPLSYFDELVKALEM